jgi:hypothetical protein
MTYVWSLSYILIMLEEREPKAPAICLMHNFRDVVAVLSIKDRKSTPPVCGGDSYVGHGMHILYMTLMLEV